jgi:hypothetical protein
VIAPAPVTAPEPATQTSTATGTATGTATTTMPATGTDTATATGTAGNASVDRQAQAPTGDSVGVKNPPPRGTVWTERPMGGPVFGPADPCTPQGGRVGAVVNSILNSMARGGSFGGAVGHGSFHMHGSFR